MGLVPTNLGNLLDLQWLDLSNNYLGRSLDFLKSLSNCSKLDKLVLDTNQLGGVLPIPVGNFLLRGKLMPLNKILGSEAETQLWALEMMPKGFRCGDKPIQARNKAAHDENSNKSPIKMLHNA